MSGRDPAAARWAAIQFVRLAAVGCVLFGIAVALGRVPGLAELPAWAGYLLIALGLFGTFALPTLLARRWRSGRP